MLTPSELARFKTKYDVDPSGCWLWNGPLDKDGYGNFYLRRRNRRAHRVAWYHAQDEIEPGMVIDHHCQVRNCVNPAHLRKITVRRNALENSRGMAALNALKTTCKNGHAFDRFYGGQRYCSICESEKSKRLRAKWRAEDTLQV